MFVIGLGFFLVVYSVLVLLEPDSLRVKLSAATPYGPQASPPTLRPAAVPPILKELEQLRAPKEQAGGDLLA